MNFAPSKANLTVIPADPPNDGFNAPNSNTRILRADVVISETGHVNLQIALRPGATEP